MPASLLENTGKLQLQGKKKKKKLQFEYRRKIATHNNSVFGLDIT